ncbi:hypothetical protein GCM10019060_16010 [Novosphingobium pokkalii]|nr:hypothetical protein GCM10019060_16010 [Novosphingobium pokkalii]
MLDHATGEIGGNAHVEYAARAVGHDIDPAAFGFALHGARLREGVRYIKPAMAVSAEMAAFASAAWGPGSSPGRRGIAL